MNNITITYLGKEYQYPFLSFEEFSEDRIVCLNTYEIGVQGYEQCYNETKRFHFLTTKGELSKLEESK